MGRAFIRHGFIVTSGSRGTGALAGGGTGGRATVVAEIMRWQGQLWKFNSSTNRTLPDGLEHWLEAVNPSTATREFSVELPQVPAGQDVSLYLAAGDAGDGDEHDYIVWQNPRLVADGLPDLQLRHIAGLRQRVLELQRQLREKAADYLNAAADVLGADEDPKSAETDLKALAAQRGLHSALLNTWMDYLRSGKSGAVKVTGHFTQRSANPEYAFVTFWGTVDTPTLGANASDQEVRISGRARPHAIHCHPSPTLFTAASPARAAAVASTASASVTKVAAAVAATRVAARPKVAVDPAVAATSAPAARSASAGTAGSRVAPSCIPPST